MSRPCKYCHVDPQYPHYRWCKVERAPTAEEIARAVIDEYDRSCGYDGPSFGLVGMCRAFLSEADAEARKIEIARQVRGGL